MQRRAEVLMIMSDHWFVQYFTENVEDMARKKIYFGGFQNNIPWRRRWGGGGEICAQPPPLFPVS